MPRPRKCRWVGREPEVTRFKPVGVPARGLAAVELGLDELEALRLADLEGLYHEAAAKRMGVSRPTFGRLVERARQKVASALIRGQMLVFEGGPVAMSDKRRFHCEACGEDFEVERGTGRPEGCPACGAETVYRVDQRADSTEQAVPPAIDDREEPGQGSRAGNGGGGRGRGRGHGRGGGGHGRGGRGGRGGGMRRRSRDGCGREM